MKKLTLTEARANFSEILDSIEDTAKSVIVTRYNKEVATIISFKEYNRLKSAAKEAKEQVSSKEKVKKIQTIVKNQPKTASNDDVSSGKLFGFFKKKN
jgi:prevent-host-death family protein